MPDMSSGTALRNLQQAQAGLRKARQLLRTVRGDADQTPRVMKAGWEGLANAHKILSEIPIGAVNEPVMTKQLAVERYATALLVRLRRLLKYEPAVDLDDDETDFEDA